MRAFTSVLAACDEPPLRRPQRHRQRRSFGLLRGFDPAWPVCPFRSTVGPCRCLGPSLPRADRYQAPSAQVHTPVVPDRATGWFASEPATLGFCLTGLVIRVKPNSQPKEVADPHLPNTSNETPRSPKSLGAFFIGSSHLVAWRGQRGQANHFSPWPTW